MTRPLPSHRAVWSVTLAMSALVVFGAADVCRAWDVSEWGKGVSSLDVDSDGNVYVVGGSCANYGGGEGMLKLRPTDGAFLDRWWPIRQFSCGMQTVVVDPWGDPIVRFSQYSTIQKRPSCNLAETVWSAGALSQVDVIAVDHAGNVLTGGAPPEAAVSKLRGADGHELWRAGLAAPGSTGNSLVVTAIAAAANGDALAAGSYLSQLAVARFSADDGSLQWERHFAGTAVSSANQANAVVTDSAGNVIVVGRLLNGPIHGFAVCKVSPAGTDYWPQGCRVLDGTNSNCTVGSCCGTAFVTGGDAQSVAVDASDDLVVGGYFRNGSACVASNAFTVVKLSGASGQELWPQQPRPFSIPSLAQTRVVSVRVDPHGDVLAAGEFSPTYNEVPGIVKASGASGTIAWTYSPPGTYGRTRGMVLDDRGNPTIAISSETFRVIKRDGTTGGDFVGESCDNGVDDDGDGLGDALDLDCRKCGNGIVEPGEPCDDGNTRSGDGCSGDCTNADTDYALLARYAPILELDATNPSVPISIASFLGAGAEITRDDAPTLSAISVDDVRAVYGDDRNAGDDDFITPGIGGVCAVSAHVYGHVQRRPYGDLWLQYWMLYRRHVESDPATSHDGDWHLVAVHLPTETAVPDRVLYTSGAAGAVCGWNAFERSGDHSIVYVAAGSNSIYLAPASTDEDGNPDRHLGDGPTVTPVVEQIDEMQTRWLGWPGRWGATDIASAESPVGPTFLADGDLWADPDAAGWDTCE